jgi:hypothetical protein
VTVIATGFEQAGARVSEEERAPVAATVPFKRDRDWPAYLRKKAVGAENFLPPELAIDQEDLDIPTFLRKQAD